MDILFKLLDPEAKLPTYATPGAACFDIYANETVRIEGEHTALVPTGWAVGVPYGYEMQIRGRSGISLGGVIVLNSPGTIDSDYRGEVKVMLRNLNKDAVCFVKGDRIAQGIIKEAKQYPFRIVQELSETIRGEGGFGHTGVK